MPAPSLSIIQTDVPAWQQMLSDLVTDPQELLALIGLTEAELAPSARAAEEFPLKIPRGFVSRIRRGDPSDPVLRQFWPHRNEEVQKAGYINDPLQEGRFNPVPGLLHKYTSRVLLTAAPHCAIHCRYCFRRHFDYEGNAPSRDDWQAAFAHIAGDQRIREVILSGGDPLALSNKQLAWLLDQAEAIEHIQTLRLHTRMTVVLPQRLDAELCERLVRSRLKLVVVSHCNHAQELSHESELAFKALRRINAVLLNQSVVLSEVNDNFAALKALSEALFQQGVLPYYLHLPDAVAGTAHFDVALAKAQALIAALRAELPGYLVPRLVREEPGNTSKTPYA